MNFDSKNRSPMQDDNKNEKNILQKNKTITTSMTLDVIQDNNLK